MARRPSLRVSVAREDPAWTELLPGAARLLSGAARRAYHAAWGNGWRGSAVGHECNLLLTGDPAMRALNRHWRGRNHATNVLAFAALDAGRPAGDLPWMLGDVVLASGVIGREARRQRKSFADHALHMVVHGVLHLLGYDHRTRAEALAMERLEIAALGQLGIASPYR
jgi:probable rRNA maturation factor